jgi:hypothetical protein
VSSNVAHPFFVYPDVKQRPQKKKRVKKNKKKDKSLIEESIVRVGLRPCFPSTNKELTLCGSGQMQSSKPYTGSSRTTGQNTEAEGVTGHASLCNAPSTSKHRLEEARQGEDGPFAPMGVPVLQQDAEHKSVSVMDQTHSTLLSPEGPAALFTSTLPPSATEGRLDHPEHHDIRSRRPTTAPNFTTTSGSPEELTPIGSTASKSSTEGSSLNGNELAAARDALHDFYGSEQRKKLGDLSDGLTGISCISVPSGSRITTANSIGQTPRLWTSRSPSCLDLERVPIVDLADLVDGSMHGRTNEQDILDMDDNNGCDVDADFSAPMVEDQFELQLGTTFNPHLVCQLSPYNESIGEQQDDIVLEDSILECAEDSAMEDPEAESREVVSIATAPRMVQPSSIPLLVSNEYVSPSGALHWPSVETPAFVDTVAPIFRHPILPELHTSDSVALQRLVFPQAVPQQVYASLIISDPVQSSTSIAEIQSPKYQEPVGSLESPITVLGNAASRTASCSSPSPPFHSPPRAVSTPASPLTCVHLWDHQREIEGVDREIDAAQAINLDAGIQRDLRWV